MSFFLYSAKKTLGLQSSDLLLVTEEDGTPVDSDDFLPFLDKGCFIVLCQGEQYDTRATEGKMSKDHKPQKGAILRH